MDKKAQYPKIRHCEIFVCMKLGEENPDSDVTTFAIKNHIIDCCFKGIR